MCRTAAGHPHAEGISDLAKIPRHSTSSKIAALMVMTLYPPTAMGSERGEVARHNSTEAQGQDTESGNNDSGDAGMTRDQGSATGHA